MLHAHRGLTAFLLVCMPACSSRRDRDAAREPVPRCATYVTEIKNFSRGVVTAFAMPPNSLGIGVYLGDVTAGSTRSFTLPRGSSFVRIERERGVVPQGDDIQRRTTCAPA